MSAGPLPNLLVAGVPKAGTTSLFGYLAQHPDICGATVKEVGYFHAWDPGSPNAGARPNVEEYRAHFAHCAGARYAMEATPSYCYGRQPVIDAIRELLGSPKIILSLRNPTDRLWSGYTFQRSKGNLGHLDSFESYVDEALKHHRAGTDRTGGRRLQGLATGFYADYLPAWIQAFGKDLRVIFAEELGSDPVAVLSELFRWLGVDPLPPGELDLGSRNVTVHARSSRMARAVFGMKRAGDRLGVLPRQIREPLRRAYLGMNTRPADEKLSPAMRIRVDELYEASNRATADALRAHGMNALPPWLEPARPPG